MSIPDGGPAFPVGGFPGDTFFKPVPPHAGMTLRDYFAAHAPSLPAKLGVLAEEAADIESPDKTHGEKCAVLLEIAAEWRYRYADAMLAARSSPAPGGGKE